MSREDVVAVACRLFSLFILATLIRTFPAAGAALLQQNSSLEMVLIIGAAVACVLAGCALLWFFPLTIARKLLPVMKEARSETAMDSSRALSVGLTLVGIWMVGYSLPDLVYWVTHLMLVYRSGDTSFSILDEQGVAALVSTLAEVALGFWLILGSTGIKRMIYRWRYGASISSV